jgi:hypothetical protein
MRLFSIGLLVGIAAGVAAASLFVLLQPSRSWEEQSVRGQAQSLGCGLSVGLGATCVPVAELKKDGPGSWTVRYGNATAGRHFCYELWPTGRPPHRRACP